MLDSIRSHTCPDRRLCWQAIGAPAVMRTSEKHQLLHFEVKVSKLDNPAALLLGWATPAFVCTPPRMQAWGTLPTKERQAAMELGFECFSWDASPRSMPFAWDELSAEQHATAASLGYNAESWASADGVSAAARDEFDANGFVNGADGDPVVGVWGADKMQLKAGDVVGIALDLKTSELLYSVKRQGTTWKREPLGVSGAQDSLWYPIVIGGKGNTLAFGFGNAATPMSIPPPSSAFKGWPSLTAANLTVVRGTEQRILPQPAHLGGSGGTSLLVWKSPTGTATNYPNAVEMTKDKRTGTLTSRSNGPGFLRGSIQMEMGIHSWECECTRSRDNDMDGMTYGVEDASVPETQRDRWAVKLDPYRGTVYFSQMSKSSAHGVPRVSPAIGCKIAVTLDMSKRTIAFKLTRSDGTDHGSVSYDLGDSMPRKVVAWASLKYTGDSITIGKYRGDGAQIPWQSQPELEQRCLVLLPSPLAPPSERAGGLSTPGEPQSPSGEQRLVHDGGVALLLPATPPGKMMSVTAINFDHGDEGIDLHMETLKATPGALAAAARPNREALSSLASIGANDAGLAAASATAAAMAPEMQPMASAVILEALLHTVTRSLASNVLTGKLQDMSVSEAVETEEPQTEDFIDATSTTDAEVAVVTPVSCRPLPGAALGADGAPECLELDISWGGCRYCFVLRRATHIEAESTGAPAAFVPPPWPPPSIRVASSSTGPEKAVDGLYQLVKDGDAATERNGAPCYTRGDAGGAIYFDGVFWKINEYGEGPEATGWYFSQRGQASGLPLGPWDAQRCDEYESEVDYSGLVLEPVDENEEVLDYSISPAVASQVGGAEAAAASTSQREVQHMRFSSSLGNRSQDKMHETVFDTCCDSIAFTEPAIEKGTGVHIIDIKVHVAETGSNIIGVGSLSNTQANYDDGEGLFIFPATGSSVGIHLFRTRLHPVEVVKPAHAGYATGDTIQLRVDTDTMLLSVFKNGSHVCDVESIPSGWHFFVSRWWNSVHLEIVQPPPPVQPKSWSEDVFAQMVQLRDWLRVQHRRAAAALRKLERKEQRYMAAQRRLREEMAQSSLEQYMPPRILQGLLPATLLETYDFYEDLSELGLIHGYPQRPMQTKSLDELEEKERWRVEAEMRRFRLLPQKRENYETILIVRLVKPEEDHAVHSLTHGTSVFATVRRVPMGSTGGKPSETDGHVLLSMATAAEGTQLHALAQCLGRVEPLSHVLAWADASHLVKPPPKASTAAASRRKAAARASSAAQAHAADNHVPPSDIKLAVDLIELPRLKLTLHAQWTEAGEWRLSSADHGGFYVVDAMVQREAELPSPLRIPGAPHALLLRSHHGEYRALVPNVRPVRPRIADRPFSTELVLVRDSQWLSRASTPHFTYPVHVSGTFLEVETLAASMYLLALRLLQRDYDGAAALTRSVSTDTGMSPEEGQIFSLFSPNSVSSGAPDLSAVRCRLALALASAHVPFPWDVRREQAMYTLKLAHMSARCRLSESDERSALRYAAEWHAMIDILKEVEKARHPEKALLKETKIALRAKSLYASEAQAMHIFRLIRQTKGQTDLEPRMQMLLDNRRACLDVLVHESATGAARCVREATVAAAQASCTYSSHLFDVPPCSRENLVMSDGVLRCAFLSDKNVGVGRAVEWMRTMIAKGERMIGQQEVQISFLVPYEMFTFTREVSFQRPEPRHQHTFATLLSNQFVDYAGFAKSPSIFNMILRLLARNPWVCSVMPQFDGASSEKQMGFGTTSFKDSKLTKLLVSAREALIRLGADGYLKTLRCPSYGCIAPCKLPLSALLPERMSAKLGGGDTTNKQSPMEALQYAERLPAATQELSHLDILPKQFRKKEYGMGSLSSHFRVCTRLQMVMEAQVGNSSERREALRWARPIKGLAERTVRSLDMPSDYACTELPLTPFSYGPLRLSIEELNTMLRQPLSATSGLYNCIESHEPPTQLDDALPYENLHVDEHPDARTSLAASAMVRLRKDMTTYTQRKNGEKRWGLKIGVMVAELPTTPNVEAAQALLQARQALRDLKGSLEQQRARDSAFVAAATSVVLMGANDAFMPDGSIVACESDQPAARSSGWRQVHRVVPQLVAKPELIVSVNEVSPTDVATATIETLRLEQQRALHSQMTASSAGTASRSQRSQRKADVERRTDEAYRFLLLRHSQHEAAAWIDYAVSCLLSSASTADLVRLNPLLPPALCHKLLNVLSAMLLRANRIAQANRALDALGDALGAVRKTLKSARWWQLAKPAPNPYARSTTLVTFEAATSINLKLERLFGELMAPRGYRVVEAEARCTEELLAELAESMEEEPAALTGEQSETGDGDNSSLARTMTNTVDPRFLVFEYVRTLLLRTRQVDLVNACVHAVEGSGHWAVKKGSLVKQMIMGQGKTTVVSPLICLMLAQGAYLVVQCVPPALLTMSAGILRNTFSSVICKRVMQFACDRQTAGELTLRTKFAAARDDGSIILTTPPALKSMMLKFVENLLVITSPHEKQHGSRDLKPETLVWGDLLKMFEKGVCIMDEVDWGARSARHHHDADARSVPVSLCACVSVASTRWRDRTREPTHR